VLGARFAPRTASGQGDPHDQREDGQEHQGYHGQEDRAHYQEQLAVDLESVAQGDLGILGARGIVENGNLVPTRGGALVPSPFWNSTVLPSAVWNRTDGKITPLDRS
jgi:hypothetical protein